MPQFQTPRLLTQWEYATLARDPLHGRDQGIIKRSGSSIAGNAEFGNYERLLALMGESGWEAVGVQISQDGQQSLLFKRAIHLPMK